MRPIPGPLIIRAASLLLFLFSIHQRAGAVSLSIAPCKNCPRETSGLFEKTLDLIKHQLTHVDVIDGPTATYALKDTAMARNDDFNFLLRVSYNSEQEPIFGSARAKEWKDKFEAAIDSILVQTLFKNGKNGGPYEQPKVTSCKKLRDAFELQVTWGNHGLGLERALYYEFVTLTQGRLQVFVFFDQPLERDEKAIATVVGAPLVTKESLECPSTPFFLLMHTAAPVPIQERQHAPYTH
jgi:hypothetical protein